MDINKLIAFRRAVYPSQFNKGEIDKATLDQLLENANMAPTHKMTQPWFFKVYKNKAKARLGQAMVQAMEAHNPDDPRFDFKKKKTLEKCRLSNCVLGIFMKRSTAVSIP
ncbi:MAG TPA: nitroreductase, partial [Flavobacteriaceae bacterium]|nr:nitroreductase [Flavobacteriaceae bacterium]